MLFSNGNMIENVGFENEIEGVISAAAVSNPVVLIKFLRELICVFYFEIKFNT